MILRFIVFYWQVTTGTISLWAYLPIKIMKFILKLVLEMHDCMMFVVGLAQWFLSRTFASEDPGSISGPELCVD